MKQKLLTMAAAALLTIGTAALPAQTVCPNCPNGGVPQQDGTGQKAQKGKRGQQGQQDPKAGRKTGPQDGTGPMHTPSRQGRRGGGRGPR